MDPLKDLKNIIEDIRILSDDLPEDKREGILSRINDLESRVREIGSLPERINKRSQAIKAINYCDDCVHFIAGNPIEDLCELKNKMKFKCPSGPNLFDWGFYSPGCKHFERD